MALILIVDDSPTEVLVMQKALERHGFQTAAAENGAEGIRKAGDEAGLHLHGYRDAGLNGFQATRTLANDPETRSIPDDHGDDQGPGDRPRLGHAPGGGGLPREARHGDKLVEKAQAALAG